MMRGDMVGELIDAQVHLGRPGESGPGVTADEMVAAMHENRVTAALITGRTQIDRDNAYMLEAAENHPSEFGVIGVVDAASPDLDHEMGELSQHRSLLGLRMSVITEQDRAKWRIGVFNRLFASATRHTLPICVWLPTLRLSELVPFVKAHPDLQFVLDHLGLPQPTRIVRADNPPMRRLADVVRLAQYPNVAIKITGAPTLSEGLYPFVDLWPALHRIISAYGLQRTMWGSDWTRVKSCTYAEGIDYIRLSNELSPSDKEWLFSRTLRRIFRWPSTDKTRGSLRKGDDHARS
jgi:predicted TIM-barrel fold metal-dependent hydrolase